MNMPDWSNNNLQGSFEKSKVKDISNGSKCSSKYLKNLKIFLWKKRRFRLRWDSSPGLSIAGRLL